jgi:hypothetical protein
VPEIDSYSEVGKKPGKRAQGKLDFEGISFSYPSRPDVPVSGPDYRRISPVHFISGILDTKGFLTVNQPWADGSTCGAFWLWEVDGFATSPEVLRSPGRRKC